MEGCRVYRRLVYANKGMSLIEILIVVAILGILTGGASVGISLAYSRDAEKCAKTINTALENARMMAMSQQGNFVLELDMDNNKLTITQLIKEQDGSETRTVVYEEDLQKRVNIYLSSEESEASATTVTVQFDKSTGKVSSMSGGTAEGILKITSENNSGKIATVVLIKGTGKHYVEYK